MVRIEVEKLTSFKQRNIGLMFSDSIRPVYFETRFGIHTFFVKKAIDVLILDGNNCVRDIKLKLKPGRVFLWNPKYSKVIELPEGQISKLSLTKGTKIDVYFI